MTGTTPRTTTSTRTLTRTGHADAANGVARPSRPLLLAGLVAGPVYITTSLAQALTREGFDPSRHAWSMLAAGDLGWIQRANLLLTGALVVLLAAGLRAPLADGRGSTWVPRLVGLFGVGMVLASFFSADPALGFPPGTAEDYRQMSWHGAVHMVTASTGFLGAIAASWIMARRFSAQGQRVWATCSAATGVFFVGALVGLSATGNPFWILTFTGAIVVVFTWLAALAVRALTRPSL